MIRGVGQSLARWPGCTDHHLITSTSDCAADGHIRRRDHRAGNAAIDTGAAAEPVAWRRSSPKSGAASALRTPIRIEQSTRAGSQFVVPVSVERMGMDRHTSHLGRTHNEPGLVASLVVLGLDARALGGARMANEIIDGLEGTERAAAPILGDVAEEPMPALVPFDATAKAGAS